MSLQLVSGRHVACLVFGLFASFTNVKMTWGQCETTVQTRDVGQFSADPIDEASGLALASDGAHFFVTNDSGDAPRFFRTRLDGSNVEEFRMQEMKDGRMKAWKPFDVEEIAVGPCPKSLSGDCVVIADIGDNRDRRKSIELGFFRVDDLPTPPSGAASSKPSFVTLAKKIKLTYPDGARNAEAFAVLNARYGLIVTKEQDRKSRATKPAGVYVVDFDTAKIVRVGQWDVPSWVKDSGLASLVTSLAVARSSGGGTLRVLLLTYRDVIEVLADTDILSSVAWPPGPWSVQSKSILRIDPLMQQEAITFDKTGTGFYYTTEAPLALLGSKFAPIRRVEKMSCP